MLSKGAHQDNSALRPQSSVLAGLSPALRSKLVKLGIAGDFDLVLHLPLRYLDETHIFPIAHAPYGQMVQVEVWWSRPRCGFGRGVS